MCSRVSRKNDPHWFKEGDIVDFLNKETAVVVGFKGQDSGIVNIKLIRNSEPYAVHRKALRKIHYGNPVV